jgi:hypothetical protein
MHPSALLSSLGTQEVDYGQAREFPGWADLWAQNENAFVADGDAPEVVRHSVAADGTLTEEGRLSFSNFGVDADRFGVVDAPNWRFWTLDLETLRAEQTPDFDFHGGGYYSARIAGKEHAVRPEWGLCVYAGLRGSAGWKRRTALGCHWLGDATAPGDAGAVTGSRGNASCDGSVVP